MKIWIRRYKCEYEVKRYQKSNFMFPEIQYTKLFSLNFHSFHNYWLSKSLFKIVLISVQVKRDVFYIYKVQFFSPIPRPTLTMSGNVNGKFWNDFVYSHNISGVSWCRMNAGKKDCIVAWVEGKLTTGNGVSEKYLLLIIYKYILILIINICNLWKKVQNR